MSINNINNSYSNHKFNNKPNTSNLDRLNKLTDKLNVGIIYDRVAWTTKRIRNSSS